MSNTEYPIHKSEDEWKAELSPEAYRVLRRGGTEFPHSGAYNLHFENGTYCCAACKTPLFESTHKFRSGCGWPSFDKAIDGTIEYLKDTSHGMIRTEIRCANCGGHLGHVFDDGPTETGTRYCVNSASLDFE
ncbi:peptide-methionine (R)-S-oxide reductase [Sinomicrobium oceani]|uniref:peptide-methionine (R)-S-oxide reductase n=1 Tax=Sinomicrobium oceani TaxID=1150368 RepID=A0A1K1QBB0_9FLAO|nr:peptide-methionine (R)-S-oxide reductase MsrB [Sinomicrobium oceani]SFW56993.1 peptide-methionine (R)-S-oxide reductase [Sinomicrobium oceani]